MSGDDKVTKLLRTYLWEIQREKRGDIYIERGNIEIQLNKYFDKINDLFIIMGVGP